MKRAFAFGFLAGVLVALPAAWLRLRHGSAAPPPSTTSKDASSPTPAGETSGDDLKAARLRIASLERDLAAIRAQAALPEATRSPSPIEARLAQILRWLQQGAPNDPNEAIIYWRLKNFLDDLADDLARSQGLDKAEAMRSPDAWLAFMTSVLKAWTPPLSALEAAKLEDVKKAYIAAWEDYLKNRGAMTGLERSVARRTMNLALAKYLERDMDVEELVREGARRDLLDTEGFLDDEHQKAYFACKSLWDDAADESSDRLAVRENRDISLPSGTVEEYKAGLAAEWSKALGLRPEQESRLGPLIDAYFREVEAAEKEEFEADEMADDAARARGEEPLPGWKVCDKDGMTPESRVMITIQRRMATALDLDAAQIEKLGSWDWYIGVYREQ